MEGLLPVVPLPTPSEIGGRTGRHCALDEWSPRGPAVLDSIAVGLPNLSCEIRVTAKGAAAAHDQQRREQSFESTRGHARGIYLSGDERAALGTTNALI